MLLATDLDGTFLGLFASDSKHLGCVVQFLYRPDRRATAYWPAIAAP